MTPTMVLRALLLGVVVRHTWRAPSARGRGDYTSPSARAEFLRQIGRVCYYLC